METDRRLEGDYSTGTWRHAPQKIERVRLRDRWPGLVWLAIIALIVASNLLIFGVGLPMLWDAIWGALDLSALALHPDCPTRAC